MPTQNYDETAGKDTGSIPYGKIHQIAARLQELYSLSTEVGDRAGVIADRLLGMEPKTDNSGEVKGKPYGEIDAVFDAIDALEQSLIHAQSQVKRLTAI